MSEFLQTNHLVLDDHLAQVVVRGVRNVFETTFGVKVDSADHVILTNYQGTGDVSGVIGMIQDNLEGTLTVSFEKEVIFSIVSQIYQTAFSSMTTRVRDAVGEITNVIYALVKKSLNERGYKFKMSIPQIIVGAGHHVHHVSSGSTLVIPFKTEFGTFEVYVTVQKRT